MRSKINPGPNSMLRNRAIGSEKTEQRLSFETTRTRSSTSFYAGGRCVFHWRPCTKVQPEGLGQVYLLMESLQETCRIFFLPLHLWLNSRALRVCNAQSRQLFINATLVQFGYIWFCVSDDPAEAKWLLVQMNCCKSFLTLPVLCSIFGSRNLTKCGADFSQSADLLLSVARLSAAACLRFNFQSAGTESSAEQSVVTDQQFKDLPDKSPESNPERRSGYGEEQRERHQKKHQFCFMLH